jgi:alpha-glucosidase
MIFIHNHCDELKKGSYKQLDWGNNYLSYGRFDALNGTVTAINTSDHEINVKIPVWQLNIPNGNVMERLMETSEELYNVGRIPVMVENGDIAVTIPACSAVVYRTK